MIDYGVKLPKIDLRDYKIKVGATNVTSFELKDLPVVKNQSTVGSCVAHASSSILEWFNKKEANIDRELSVGFIYGMQGIAFNRLDSGMYLRDACKIIQQYGDCLQETAPFNIEMPECYVRLKESLNGSVYEEATICKVKSYVKCDDNEAVKYALMNNSPILASIKWYDKYKLNDDVIQFNTESDSGYHAIMVYGFNEKGWFCQNSWGKIWGNKGRFILPYEYKLREAWSFVDDKNSGVYKPKRNALFDIIYKILNVILNMFAEKN